MLFAPNVRFYLNIDKGMGYAKFILYGSTALMWANAYQWRRLDIANTVKSVELLLKAGADLNIKNNEGKTILKTLPKKHIYYKLIKAAQRQQKRSGR